MARMDARKGSVVRCRRTHQLFFGTLETVRDWCRQSQAWVTRDVWVCKRTRDCLGVWRSPSEVVVVSA